jgi:hypothetical protein
LITVTAGRLVMNTKGIAMKMKTTTKANERTNRTARIDLDLVKKAKLIGAHRNTSASEVLTDAARAGVERQYDQVVMELALG